MSHVKQRNNMLLVKSILGLVYKTMVKRDNSISSSKEFYGFLGVSSKRLERICDECSDVRLLI